MYGTRVQSLPDGIDGQNHTNSLSNKLNSVVGCQLERVKEPELVEDQGVHIQCRSQRPKQKTCHGRPRYEWEDDIN